MSYLMRCWSRDQICRVTYWIAYCKVTRMADAARLEVDEGIPHRLAQILKGAVALERDAFDPCVTAALKEFRE